MNIRFLGHSAFELSHEGTTVLIDPFITGNPQAAVTADELTPDLVALTHGHIDHLGDSVDIAKRSGAAVLAHFELAGELGEAGVETVYDPNLGGTVQFEWGWVRMVPAWHSGTTPGGTVGSAAGLVVSLGDRIVYHLGDTALFSDLALVGKRTPIDVALMCIGGHYTMDRWDAAEAARLVGARQVVPCHYNTMPVLETDVSAFKSDVEAGGDTEVVILAPGDSHTP